MAMLCEVVPTIFLLAAKLINSPKCKGLTKHHFARHNIPRLEPENICESSLNFTAHFGEINHDMSYFCKRGQSGSKKAVFAYFPSVRREIIKRLKSSIFRKKQVHF